MTIRERLFALEELYRAAGCEPACIREAHRAAIVAGHAAYAEIKNPEPRR